MFQVGFLESTLRKQLLLYVALPIAYVICGRLGLLLAVPPGFATAVFLPAGIAVTAMFVAGSASLPGTFLGSFLLNIWISYSIGHPFDVVGSQCRAYYRPRFDDTGSRRRSFPA